MDRKQYEISIRREVMLEMYAGVLVRFLDYLKGTYRSGDGDRRFRCVLVLQAVDVCRSLSDMSSEEELIAAEGQLRIFRRVANRLNGYPADAPL